MKVKARRRPPTEPELCFEHHVQELGIARTFCFKEYRFDVTREWRFDFAVPRLFLAIEIEGGIWSGGRHTRGKGYQDDLDKYNAATAAGWSIFRFSVEDVLKARDLGPLREWLGRRRNL